MAGLEDVLADVQDIRRLDIRPGDTLVVSLPERTTAQRWQQVAEGLRDNMPEGIKVMLVTGDIQMAVLRAESC